MDTELIYSLKPIYANLILNKQKNHEFRTVKPKNLPKRIWLYVSSPESKLMYLADVGEIIDYPNKIQVPGEGNQEFNNSENIRDFAYPIVHFYKIKEPITLKDLKSKFGFSAPQSFVYLDKYKKLQNYLLNKAILEKIY